MWCPQLGLTSALLSGCFGRSWPTPSCQKWDQLYSHVFLLAALSVLPLVCCVLPAVCNSVSDI